MTTLASAVWREYMKAACTLPDYPTAVFSGIVGNKLHTRGFHLSIEDNSKTDFSVIRPDDKAPPGKWPRNLASAGDRSMAKADMVKAWNRWYAVWVNRANDPRAKFFYAYNGWNGKGSPERLNFVTGERSIASSDHTWHDHREGRRRYATDPAFKRAALSIEKGESIAQYLGTNKPQSINIHGKGNDEMYMVRKQDETSVDVFERGYFRFHVENEPERDFLLRGGMQFFDGASPSLYERLTTPLDTGEKK